VSESRFKIARQRGYTREDTIVSYVDRLSSKHNNFRHRAYKVRCRKLTKYNRKNPTMTSFLVYHKEAIRFSLQRNSTDEAPLSGCNEAARLLRRPLITRTNLTVANRLREVSHESLH